MNMYCSSNPCINNRVHLLHMQVLQGIHGAELELHRYLLACAVLNNSKSCSSHEKQRKACILWTCDICGSGEHDVPMQKLPYKQQYRAWKPPGFFFCHGQQHHHELKLPVAACLLTPLQCTMQYSLLPDLGMFFRGILQRRFYSEASRKQWIKNMSTVHHMHVPSSAQQQQNKAANQVHMQQQLLQQRYHSHWGHMNGVCAMLLLESIPCMKRAKRSSTAFGAQQQQNNHNATEVLACINVMYGTLFKLYPMGAKAPTFNAKVSIMQRMLELTSLLPTQEQLEFIHRHAALMRICFMEYSINALMDWLPVERDLLFQSTAFGQHRAAMQAYSGIIVATCDVFRQDIIHSGRESWESINACASSCIDRCIRVCKFKLFRMPEPIARGPHIPAEHFAQEWMGSGMKMLGCKEVACRMFGSEESFLLHSNLRVFELPECVILQQLDAMDRFHSLCSKRLVAAQRLSFCTMCAVNGRGCAGAGGTPFNSSKLRMCCQTGDLSCTVCPAGTVVTVNMIGVLLKICSSYYFMCPR